MNIFYLDEDMELNARYHCDKHVVKMITEQTQLLCNSYYTQEDVSTSLLDIIYRKTHTKHPCSIWASESLSNWKWLRDMTLSLYKEYQHRYGKTHKAGELVKMLPTPEITDKGITARPQAMPDQYKTIDTVTAYRNYYKGEKRHLLQYKNRNLPEWL